MALAALKPAAVAARSAAANNVFMGILPWVIKVDVAICSSPAGAGGKTEAVAGLGRRGTLVSRLLTQDEPIVALRVSFKQGALHQGQSRAAVQFAFMRAAECSTSAQQNIAKHNIGGCSWIAVVFSSSPLVWPLPVQRPSLRRRPPLAPQAISDKPIEPDQIPQNAVAHDDDLKDAQLEQVRWGRRRGWGRRRWGPPQILGFPSPPLLAPPSVLGLAPPRLSSPVLASPPLLLVMSCRVRTRSGDSHSDPYAAN
jgi:hypothetical protein